MGILLCLQSLRLGWRKRPGNTWRWWGDNSMNAMQASNCMFIMAEFMRCVFYRSFFKELGKTKTCVEGGTITTLQELLTALQRKYKVIPRAATPSTRCPRPPPTFPSCTCTRLTTSLTPAWSLLLEQVTLVPEASTAAAAAKSLQSCPTLCDPIDGSPPGSPVPRILQARTLEWVAVSFSNAWKWKVKVKSLSRVLLLATPHGLQPTRLLGPWDFPGKSTGMGCRASGLPEFSSCSPWNGGSRSLSGHLLLEALPDHPTQVTRLPGHVLSQHPSYPLRARPTWTLLRLRPVPAFHSISSIRWCHTCPVQCLAP